MGTPITPTDVRSPERNQTLPAANGLKPGFARNSALQTLQKSSLLANFQARRSSCLGQDRGREKVRGVLRCRPGALLACGQICAFFRPVSFYQPGDTRSEGDPDQIGEKVLNTKFSAWKKYLDAFNRDSEKKSEHCDPLPKRRPGCKGDQG